MKLDGTSFQKLVWEEISKKTRPVKMKTLKGGKKNILYLVRIKL